MAHNPQAGVPLAPAPAAPILGLGLAAPATPSPQDEEAQRRWFYDRLQDVTLADFICPDQNVAIYSTSPMSIFPDALRDRCRTFQLTQAAGGLSADDRALIESSNAIIVFCNYMEDQEIEFALLLNQLIVQLGHYAPPTIFVPHARANIDNRLEPDQEARLFAELMNSGMDGVVSGQLTGLELATQIRCEIGQWSRAADAFNHALAAQMAQAEPSVRYAGQLRARLESGLWDYCTARMRMPIPPCSGEPTTITSGALFDKFRLGKELGTGGTATVFALETSRGQPLAQVVKMIEKSGKTCVIGLKELCNEINIMKRLAKAEFSHKNIIQLYQVYHTENHIIYRMEDGGSDNLYKYLQNSERDRRPVTEPKATCIIYQCTDALCHMQLVAKVVHRDLKCENIMLHDTGQSLCIKVGDFDLSALMLQRRTSTFEGGTFPFMAPEMVTGEAYDPFTIDIWSMGVVFCEVICGPEVLCKQLNLPRIPRGDDHRQQRQRRQLSMIHRFFDQPGNCMRMLEAYSGTELQDLLDKPAAEMIEAMMTVSAEERISGQELQDNLHLLK